jgi:hypothetical protein
VENNKFHRKERTGSVGVKSGGEMRAAI